MGKSDLEIPDYHVTKNDIRSLSSREAVCSFFSHIGYNTEARIAQTPANLSIIASSVTRQIKHIERVADQDDYLQVYIRTGSSHNEWVDLSHFQTGNTFISTRPFSLWQ